MSLSLSINEQGPLIAYAIGIILSSMFIAMYIIYLMILFVTRSKSRRVKYGRDLAGMGNY